MTEKTEIVEGGLPPTQPEKTLKEVFQDAQRKLQVAAEVHATNPDKKKLEKVAEASEEFYAARTAYEDGLARGTA